MLERPHVGMSQSSMVETIDENSPLSVGAKTIDSSDPSGNKGKNNVEDTEGNDSREKNKTKSCLAPVSIDSNLSKKKVSWNPKIVKKRHVCLKDIPQEQRDDLWYNKKEDKLTLLQAKVTVKMIMKGEPFDDIENCSRGLEGKTMIESKKRSRNKRKVVSAVMMEQELQRLEAVKNPEQLANAARKHTIELSSLAHEKGIEDKRAVEEYISDVREHLSDFHEFFSTTHLDQSMSPE